MNVLLFNSASIRSCIVLNRLVGFYLWSCVLGCEIKSTTCFILSVLKYSLVPGSSYFLFMVGSKRPCDQSNHKILLIYHFYGLEGSWGQPLGPNFPSAGATMLAVRLYCTTAGLITPQKVLPIWKLVELKMLDFSDRMRTGISSLTSAADYSYHVQRIQRQLTCFSFLNMLK